MESKIKEKNNNKYWQKQILRNHKDRMQTFTTWKILLYNNSWSRSLSYVFQRFKKKKILEKKNKELQAYQVTGSDEIQTQALWLHSLWSDTWCVASLLWESPHQYCWKSKTMPDQGISSPPPVPSQGPFAWYALSFYFQTSCNTTGFQLSDLYLWIIHL